MPFFSFSLSKIPPSLKAFNITANNLYFSKNTQLWTKLNKLCKSNINSLEYEKRNPIKNTGKKILFCLPPSIGLGDAVEYASAIKTVSDSNIFHPGQSAELQMGKKIIARYGKIHPLILEDFPKLSNTYGIELYFENLPIDSMFRRNKNFKQESNFQYSEKDFSFIFNKVLLLKIFLI